jgi:hypothetical protein
MDERWGGPQYMPGEAAPEAGTYELLNMMGSPTGTKISINAGVAFPAAPFGWTYRRAAD